MHYPRLYSIWRALGLFIFISTIEVAACGIDWKMPQNHFDGVNERGNVSYWQTIGTLDLGDDLKIPLVIGFNSSRTSSSPYLGEGWILALLEANIVQVDSKRFVMTQPDGLNIRFKRKDEAATTLEGQGGWMAEIGQDTITAWAKCGWKLVFTKGKITSITTPQNQQLTYNYQNGAVRELDKDGSPVLNVIPDANGGISGVAFSGKQILFHQGDKPDVENINGQSVIGHVSPSLSQVTLVDGTVNGYKFAVNPQLDPTLNISGAPARSFSWNPVTKFVLTDGDWTYSITPGSKIFADAQISRHKTNAPSQSEYYFHDNATGITTSQGLDGTKEIVAKFVNAGKLTGRIRSVTRIKDGVSTILRKYDYDENGRIIREMVLLNKPHEITFKYNAAGKQCEIDMDGKIYITKQYDAQGRLAAKLLADGVRMTYEYLNNEIKRTTYRKQSEVVVQMLNSNFQQLQDIAIAGQKSVQLEEQNSR